MVRLYIEPEAEAELEETADRYAEMVPDLGLEFLAEMRSVRATCLPTPSDFLGSRASMTFAAPTRWEGFRI